MIEDFMDLDHFLDWHPGGCNDTDCMPCLVDVMGLSPYFGEWPEWIDHGGEG